MSLFLAGEKTTPTDLFGQICGHSREPLAAVRYRIPLREHLAQGFHRNFRPFRAHNQCDPNRGFRFVEEQSPQITQSLLATDGMRLWDCRGRPNIGRAKLLTESVNPAKTNERHHQAVQAAPDRNRRLVERLAADRGSNRRRNDDGCATDSSHADTRGVAERLLDQPFEGDNG